MSSPPSTPPALEELLRSAFKLTSFRPYQEAVCRAVTAGRDVLLVMPTGAGKSLCYQLPGLALGGVTLVISPLIALIEDQVAKLNALGLKAERIHSGRSREDSRQVCIDYAAGRLNYLFIAPERLGVARFAEWLTRHKPALIAVDEAHCISHWGHDFRPDYRRLGERLPQLRPAPVIGMTATATPHVQDDIVEQLGLTTPARFIHGFRRTNIAVELVEQAPSERHDTVERLLGEPGRRPAIVYTRKRQEAVDLAARLAEQLPAAAYHAGMTAPERDEVQAAFLSGRLEVIVATIAFGMGIDKADVRTVLHTAIPSTLEGYYQEIGRAGRDGQPSRAVLLYSWADKRNLEYFHNLNFPATEVLASIYQRLGPQSLPKEELRQAMRLDGEVFEKALEKLWLHGGAAVDPEENVSRGKAEWREPYERLREHRLEQLGLTFRFAESHGCRMLHLVHHFGDQEDTGHPCGQCDVCAPDEALAHRFHAPSPQEERRLREILEALAETNGLTVGQLFRALGGEMGDVERKQLDRWLGGLVRAGLVRLAAESWEKEGRTIHFQRAYLTREGLREGPEGAARVQLAEAMRKAGSKKRERTPRPLRATAQAVDSGAAPALVEALRSWRLAEAKRRKVPAFHILTDRTLLAVASHRPEDEPSLLAVPGIGPTLAKKIGPDLLRIVSEH